MARSGQQERRKRLNPDGDRKISRAPEDVHQGEGKEHLQAVIAVDVHDDEGLRSEADATTYAGIMVLRVVRCPPFLRI